MEAILYFNLVISPFFGHDLQKMKKIVLLPGWLDYGITELVVLVLVYFCIVFTFACMLGLEGVLLSP